MKDKIYLYIKEKLNRKEILLKDIENRYLDRKKEIGETLDKIDKFENDHREEFDKIFPDCRYSNYCSIASNELCCELHHLNHHSYCMQHFCNEHEYSFLMGSKDEIHITFNEFCLNLNMTMKDLKYYLDDLLRNEMIFRKRSIGGYFYKLDD